MKGHKNNNPKINFLKNTNSQNSCNIFTIQVQKPSQNGYWFWFVEHIVDPQIDNQPLNFNNAFIIFFSFFLLKFLFNLI
jgi:hypothetical protein